MKRLFLLFIFLPILVFSKDINITKNWQLLAALEDINLSLVDENCIDIAWKWNFDEWSVYTGKNTTFPKHLNIQRFDSLHVEEGFWIKAYNQCTLNLEIVQNEPYFKYLWHINSKDSVFNEMGYYVDENADINILQAWKMSKGEGVKIAILDDAFDVEHEDLKENIYIAYNAIDDSNDVSNSYPLGHEYEISHGNICAGFIVSAMNRKGIIGTAPKSKLIAIKIDLDNGLLDSQIIKAFEYAKDQGAKVISCSWGSENISQALEEELKFLYENNITVLFAVGNSGISLDKSGINDESESSWVMGVGASSEKNDVTSYSNYGSKMDILSPGGDRENDIGLLGVDDSGIRGDDNQKELVTKNYSFVAGTSFATPISAGVVALMYSIKPDITPKEVRTILIESADKIGENSNYINGFDLKRAYGKINSYEALKAVQMLLD